MTDPTLPRADGVLTAEAGWPRGFVDPRTGVIHAKNTGGWTLCRRRPGKGWYENLSGFIPGDCHAAPECCECARRLVAPGSPTVPESEASDG